MGKRLNMTEEEKKEWKKLQRHETYMRNREARLAYTKEYMKKHPEKIREYNRRARAKKKAANAQPKVITRDRYFYFEDACELNTLMSKLKGTGVVIEELKTDRNVQNSKKFRHGYMLHVTWTNKTFEQIYNENDIFKYYGIPFSKITNVKHIGIPHVYVESLEPLKPVAGIDRPVAFVKKEDPKPRADILTSKTFGELFKDRVSNAADNEIYTVELSGRDLKRLPDIFNSKAIDTTHKIIKDGKHVKVTGIYDESRNKILEMVKALGIDGDDLIDILPQINALAERLSDTTEPVKETIKSIDHSGYRRVINRDGLISYEKINRDED